MKLVEDELEMKRGQDDHVMEMVLDKLEMKRDDEEMVN